MYVGDVGVALAQIRLFTLQKQNKQKTPPQILSKLYKRIENQRFNRPKKKNYITEGTIVFEKRIIVGGRLFRTRE